MLAASELHVCIFTSITVRHVARLRDKVEDNLVEDEYSVETLTVIYPFETIFFRIKFWIFLLNILAFPL